MASDSNQTSEEKEAKRLQTALEIIDRLPKWARVIQDWAEEQERLARECEEIRSASAVLPPT